MHKQKIAILIAAAVGIISIFLPWEKSYYRGTTEHLSGGADLIMFILFLIPSIIVVVDKDKKNELKRKVYKWVIIPSILAVLIAVLMMLGEDSEFGSYLCVLAGIAIPVLGAVFKGGE